MTNKRNKRINHRVHREKIKRMLKTKTKKVFVNLLDNSVLSMVNNNKESIKLISVPSVVK